ncbi:MAG: hypothetical protein ACRD1Q_18200, partial [Vicinamibacterales bacterium]
MSNGTATSPNHTSPGGPGVSSRITRARKALRRQRLVIVSVLVLMVLMAYVTQSVIIEEYESRAA